MISADQEVLVQVVPPFCHGVDDGEPFFVEDSVIALGLGKSSAEVVDRVPAIDVLLFENEWSIRLACENNEGLVLKETSER